MVNCWIFIGGITASTSKAGILSYLSKKKRGESFWAAVLRCEVYTLLPNALPSRTPGCNKWARPAIESQPSYGMARHVFGVSRPCKSHNPQKSSLCSLSHTHHNHYNRHNRHQLPANPTSKKKKKKKKQRPRMFQVLFRRGASVNWQPMPGNPFFARTNPVPSHFLPRGRGGGPGSGRMRTQRAPTPGAGSSGPYPRLDCRSAGPSGPDRATPGLVRKRPDHF